MLVWYGWIGYAIAVALPGWNGLPVTMASIHLLLALVPDLEEAVPGPCCHSHAVISHPQAADSVVMPS